MLIGGLPKGIGAGQPAKRAERAVNGLLPPRGLDRSQVAGVARVADLFGPGVLEVEAVVGERHPRDLPVVVVERGQVGFETTAERLGVGSARIQCGAAGTA